MRAEADSIQATAAIALAAALVGGEWLSSSQKRKPATYRTDFADNLNPYGGRWSLESGPR